MEELKVKVGDKLIYHSYGLDKIEKIATVTKVTPTGRMRIDCNDGQYDKYGKIMGQKNIWDTRSYLTIPTDEDIKRIEENNTIAKALYMVRELNKDNLDYDRAVKIMEILQ